MSDRKPSVFEENFEHYQPPDPVMFIAMAICALADEVRELRVAYEKAARRKADVLGIESIAEATR